MAAKVLNRSFQAAKKAREDEFYTQLPDIERELRHYKTHFARKVVFLNCDDPRVSNFFHYFSYKFETLGLKKLIAACYKSQNADLSSARTTRSRRSTSSTTATRIATTSLTPRRSASSR